MDMIVWYHLFKKKLINRAFQNEDRRDKLRHVAKFEKVTYNQFKQAVLDKDKQLSDNQIKEIYDGIKLPQRATKGSAGYDFCLPQGIVLGVGNTEKVPTGIRVKINDGWVLKCYPRSSLGFKYRTQLDNTVGIIDSDYYNSDNEGHIFAKITNDSKSGKTLTLDRGNKFMQGVFVQFGITVDDNVTGIRNGGIGSSGE